jgi:hypothetical protein
VVGLVARRHFEKLKFSNFLNFRFSNETKLGKLEVLIFLHRNWIFFQLPLTTKKKKKKKKKSVFFFSFFFFFFVVEPIARMIATLISMSVLLACAYAQDATTPTEAPATTTTTTTPTTAKAGASTKLNSQSSVDEWVEYYVASAKAYVAASGAATSAETGAADCGGVWNNVSSVLAQTSDKGTRFGSGRTTAFCYSLYYSCAAAVKNVTIGDAIYPPDLFVFDDNGNQKAKPPTWDAFAVGMCKCKKPLLICFDALNCNPDNNDGKHDICYAIKKECNRGECPSRGVFCDVDETCGWNDAAIAAYSDADKAAILAMRAEESGSASTSSIAIFAVSIAIAFNLI